MKYKYSKIALAVICFNSSVYIDSAPESSQDESFTIDATSQMSGGWRWGITSAAAGCGDNSDGTYCDDRMTVTPGYDYHDIWLGDGEPNRGGDLDSGEPNTQGGGPGGEQISTEEAEALLEDPDAVADSITTLLQVKNDISRALAQEGLSEEMRLKLKGALNQLDGALSKANVYLGVLNSAGQLGMDIKKGEYIEAVAEVAGLVAGFGVGVTVSGPALGVVASFATVYVVERGTSYILNAASDFYDVVVYDSSRFDVHDDFLCRYQAVRMQGCRDTR
ncbi:hypothetical protein [Idiomarina abyssalis]|uniref:hypothetical protein n=1 Tax=Idiomarina abyssalis TaxID=86102 RepID=UPI003A913BA9